MNHLAYAKTQKEVEWQVEDLMHYVSKSEREESYRSILCFPLSIAGSKGNLIKI